MYYQTPNCFFCTANTKTKNKHTLEKPQSFWSFNEFIDQYSFVVLSIFDNLQIQTHGVKAQHSSKKKSQNKAAKYTRLFFSVKDFSCFLNDIYRFSKKKELFWRFKILNPSYITTKILKFRDGIFYWYLYIIMSIMNLCFIDNF